MENKPSAPPPASDVATDAASLKNTILFYAVSAVVAFPYIVLLGSVSAQLGLIFGYGWGLAMVLGHLQRNNPAAS